MSDTGCEYWKECATFIQTGEASNFFIEHLDNCEYCGVAVEDAFDHQARAFEDLAVNLRQDEKMRAIIRRFVEDILTSTARDIARRFDHLTLLKATEAASVLIREHLDLVRPNAKIIELHADGSVSMDGEIEIPRKALALEIARFTDLGLFNQPCKRGVAIDVVKPFPEAFYLAEWIYLAGIQIPRLLRHFQITEQTKTGLRLVPVIPLQVTQDVALRWFPPVR